MATCDHQAREADALRAKLVTVEAEIARFQVHKAFFDECLRVVQHRVEEITLQMEQEQRECEEQSRQFVLPKTNAARIKVKETVHQIILDEMYIFLNHTL